MCAHAVRVAIQKLDGMEAVEVSLNQGLATVRFQPGNRVTVEAVRAAIRANGFTPKAAEVRVSGELTDYQGKPALALPETHTVYILRPGPSGEGGLAQLKGLARGARLTIEGEVTESSGTGSAEPLPLLVRSLVVGR